MNERLLETSKTKCVTFYGGQVCCYKDNEGRESIYILPILPSATRGVFGFMLTAFYLDKK